MHSARERAHTIRITPMVHFKAQKPTYMNGEYTIVTTPFLQDMLDSALIANIQHGHIEAAYEVLDLLINLTQSMEGSTLTPSEGKTILSKVKSAMKQGNLATAKQHMVEFALR